MIVRLYSPVEKGQPAIWFEGTIRSDEAPVCMLRRNLREYPSDAPTIDLVMSGEGGNLRRTEEMVALLGAEPRPKRVTILRAMSAHGVLAMAGDRVRILENGALGLHNSRMRRDDVVGLVDDDVMPATALRHLASLCEEVDQRHAALFARRTGLTTEHVTELLSAETILTAHEAVRLGFADEVIPC